MASTSTRPELVAIVGPTASGKSDLAMKIAQKFNGEIIAADSRTLYKGMNIGTAKPTKADQTKIKHWGLDLIEPGQRFTAYQFKKYAQQAIENIQKRGKLSILVGGTGLYIDGVLFDFGFLPGYDPAKRQKLESLSVKELQAIIKEKGYLLPENRQNRRHLIRTIETKGQARSKKNIAQEVISVGIMPPDKVLKRRIDQRVEDWLSGGLIDETKQLLSNYGEGVLRAGGGIGYRLIADYLSRKTTLGEAKKNFKREHWQYARRQKTWFKRNKSIQWFKTPEQAYKYIKQQLNT